ncbi:MAG: NAD(P)H-hydrate dehydratase [Coprobacter sp.]|nr:NAD(P)H-hydrate dehydratase [Coprobacter sp.]
MKIFPTGDIKEIDRYTIQHEPIASIELMERAATAITEAIVARWDTRHPVVVFAGPGNNGGDGLAVARMLQAGGYMVECYLFNPRQNLSPDCLANLARLKESDCTVHEITKEFTPPRLDAHTLVIDALFGSGLSRPLEKAYAAVVQYINASGATIVSIDIPSGMLGDDCGLCRRENIIHPTLTLTLQFPKLAFFTAEEAPLTGEWQILDIGLHPDIIQDKDSPYHYTTHSDVATLLRHRNRFSHKYDYGHLLIVAGCRGMLGAGLLSTRAALHSGAGLVTLHTAACGESVVQTAIPEAIFSPDNDTERVTHIPDNRHYNAIAVGPGMGRDDKSRQALIELIGRAPCPMVLDADALNMLSENPLFIERLPRQTILTPHSREFDRLFGPCNTRYERLQKARDLCRRLGIIIVLKGAYTIVVTPDGNAHINSTGNPGMATAGSGDTLTGIISALLAQGYPPTEAAILGVYLHGMAGDIAAAEESQEYITAGDIIKRLGKAFRQLENTHHQ